MNHSKDRKKRFVSLRTKAFKVILAGSLLLLLAGIAAGLLLHTYTSLRHYKGEAQHLLDTIMALEDDAYIEKIFRETKRIYESLPEDVRSDQMSCCFQTC